MVQKHIKDIESQIINIIQSHKIREQSELQGLLKKIGYDIPQATLSRKLSRLKIAKINGVYQIVEFNLPSLPVVLNIQVSDSGLIVLHTHPGHANVIAYFIDQKYIKSSF